MSDPFPDDFSDLDSFANDYEPKQAFDPPFDDLADGGYTFEVMYADLTKAKNNDRIFNLGLRVDGGATFKYTYWLNKQTEVNKLGAGLALLGFEAHKWGKEVPLSIALPDAARRLPGIKFKGSKTSSKGTRGDKTFHNLNITCRITADTKPAPAAPAAAPAHASGDLIDW